MHQSFLTFKSLYKPKQITANNNNNHSNTVITVFIYTTPQMAQVQNCHPITKLSQLNKPTNTPKEKRETKHLPFRKTKSHPITINPKQNKKHNKTLNISIKLTKSKTQRKSYIKNLNIHNLCTF